MQIDNKSKEAYNKEKVGRASKLNPIVLLLKNTALTKTTFLVFQVHKAITCNHL